MSNPEEQANQAAQEAAAVAQQTQQQQQTTATEPLNVQTPETQVAKDQQATQKIEKNIDENNADKQYKENLRTLQRLVAQASPIVEVKNGQKVVTGYNYYHIDGKPIEEWTQETFGGKVTLDKDKREIKINDNDNQNNKPNQTNTQVNQVNQQTQQHK